MDISLFDSAQLSVLVTEYGYSGLLLVCFLSAFALPIPASVAIATAGVLASAEMLNIWMVIGIALSANVLGDFAGYGIGQRTSTQGEHLRGWLLRDERGAMVREVLLRHPAVVIYSSRFITTIGPLVNVLSGYLPVRFRVFVVFDVLGELSYSAFFALAGYTLGDAWQNESRFLWTGIAVLISFGLVVAFGRAMFRDYRRE